MKINGIVTKSIGGKFEVLCGGNKYLCNSRQSVKKEVSQLIVGDKVELDTTNNIITGVKKRENYFVRPLIANINQIVIVLSVLPKADLILTDKLLVNCYLNNIIPVICINKNDIADKKFIEDIYDQYGKYIKIISTSATEKTGKNDLLDILKDKITGFAGQSAVGKTSLLNLIFPGLQEATGDLSNKTERGKHTTRHTQLYQLPTGGLVADTPGFSLLELSVPSKSLNLYYPEFNEIQNNCKFKSDCMHITEPDCAVKKHIAEGKISKERYLRYCFIYDELKDSENYKYRRNKFKNEKN